MTVNKVAVAINGGRTPGQDVIHGSASMVLNTFVTEGKSAVTVHYLTTVYCVTIQHFNRAISRAIPEGVVNQVRVIISTRGAPRMIVIHKGAGVMFFSIVGEREFALLVFAVAVESEATLVNFDDAVEFLGLVSRSGTWVVGNPPTPPILISGAESGIEE